MHVVAANVEGGLARTCDPKRKEAAQLYNTRIHKMVAGLNVDMGFTTMLVLLDISHLLDDLMEHREKYCFSETTNGCCRTSSPSSSTKGAREEYGFSV
jgi:phospholipase/lecithinase/hemolysin